MYCLCHSEAPDDVYVAFQCDTSRHLEWLKTIKESHGSVALTSLVQAEAINSRGVYIVGRQEAEDALPEDQERQLSVDSVISLTVPPKDDSEEAESKTYSLDDLKDLQSKLMLIAGKASKGKDEVDAFVKVGEKETNEILKIVVLASTFCLCFANYDFKSFSGFLSL